MIRRVLCPGPSLTTTMPVCEPWLTYAVNFAWRAAPRGSAYVGGDHCMLGDWKDAPPPGRLIIPGVLHEQMRGCLDAPWVDNQPPVTRWEDLPVKIGPVNYSATIGVLAALCDSLPGDEILVHGMDWSDANDRAYFIGHHPTIRENTKSPRWPVEQAEFASVTAHAASIGVNIRRVLP